MTTYQSLYLPIKLFSFALTAVLVYLMSLFVSLDRLELALLVPFMLDFGHFSLSAYYKLKKEVKREFFIKLGIALISCFILSELTSPAAGRWMVYVFGAWHVASDEQFISSSKMNVGPIDIFHTLAGYSYLSFIKFFNIDAYKYAGIISAVIFLLYVGRMVALKKLSKEKSVFIVLSLFNCFCLFIYKEISTQFVVLFYIFFHYVSWYLYYSFKTKEKIHYGKSILLANGGFIAVLLIVGMSSLASPLAAYISKSFFVPGALLVHLITSLRG